MWSKARNTNIIEFKRKETNIGLWKKGESPIVINKSLKKENIKIIDSRHKTNFLFEYEILWGLAKNKYGKFYDYYVEYKKIINQTITKFDDFKFTNNYSLTESFSDLETTFDQHIMSQIPVIELINKISEHAKSIIKAYDK